jgi:tetratricopeptide (TPR) repeat protein
MVAGHAPRKLPRSAFVLLLALAMLAVVVNAAWWLRPERILPLPAIPIEELEPQVAAIIETARHQVERDDHSAMAWGDLGAALRAHDLGPQADVCFRNAESLDPNDYRWPYLLGVSLTTTDADEGLACLRRAAALAGNRPHVLLRLAESLLDRRLTTEAAAVINRVLSFAPSNPRAQLAQARLLLLQGDWERSCTWAEKSAAGAPDKRAPHLLLAQICRRRGDEAGEDRALAALKSIPDGITSWEDPDIEVLMGLRQDRRWRLENADQLATSGQIESAADAFAEMARENDSSAAATLKLVQTYYQQQKYAEAAKALREQLQRREDDERVHFQLGVACFFQQRFGVAAREFRRTIELKPDHVDAHYNLGHALRKNDQLDEAQQAFAAAVSLRPGHTRARANLAELLMAKGEIDEANQHLEIVARHDPNDPILRKLRKGARPRNVP